MRTVQHILLKTTSRGEGVNSGDLSRDIFNVCGTSHLRGQKHQDRAAQAESLLSEVIDPALACQAQMSVMYESPLNLRCSIVASFPDLPAHPQTLYTRLFFYPLKAGRSGRFYAIMMMSPGRGLARHGRGLEE